jgi:phage terminase large subunit-like protein
MEVKVSNDKIARAKDATPTAEAGMIYIKKSMADRLYNDSKQGILFFPNGQYADLADTLSQMIVRRVKRGKIVSSGAQKTEEAKENPLDWLE